MLVERISSFADPATDNEVRPHPHGVFPFTALDTSDVTFTAPGMYLVSLQVTDDNGGTNTISLPKAVVDDCECTRSQGYWSNELRKAAEGKTNGRMYGQHERQGTEAGAGRVVELRLGRRDLE